MKPSADGQAGMGKESPMKKTFSKKRKLETTCPDGEVEVDPLEREAPRGRTQPEPCAATSTQEPAPPATEMKRDYLSRIPHQTVIRSSETKTPVIQYNGKKTGFSSASIASGNDCGFEPALVPLDCKAKETETASTSTSNQGERSEDTLLSEPEVLEVTTCRATPPEARCTQTLTLDNQRKIKEAEVLKSQEETPAASQNQQAFHDEKLPPDTQNPASDDLRKLLKRNTFLLDATKEGNVGRFFNHSCCPNLLVQNVFVETHDRNLPLVAFFTNRHVRARTELTWDYGYEAGSVPEKETLCLCGAVKCRKRIL